MMLYQWPSVRRSALAKLSLAQRFAIERSRAQRALQRLKTFDPNQPRDEDGKWTDTGAGDGSESAPPAAALDPTVVEVGGDEWNRAVARRLESEFQAVRAEVDKLAQAATGAITLKPTSDDEDDPPYVPEEWEGLSNSGQEQVENHWKDAHKQSYIDSEEQNYYDSGSALDDAKGTIVYEYEKGDETEWAIDAVTDVVADRAEAGKPIPFTEQQLIDAISLEYETGYEGKGDLTVEFDDSKLQEPAGFDPSQQTLPGIEPVKPEARLTPEMREEITKALEKAFDKKGDDKMPDMKPPDYIYDSVDELLDDSWSQMDDSEKFEYAKDHTDVVNDESTGVENPEMESAVVEGLPNKFDPLNEGSAQDYRRTQKLAAYLSIARAREVITARIKDVATPSDEFLAKVDKRLWGAWKSSSTSLDGQLLQIATAEELGGRLNTKTSTEINVEDAKKLADLDFAKIGGYAGVKAYVRAKWEVTQYLLDQAGIDELKLYRGIRLESEVIEKMLVRHMAAAKVVEGHTHLPTLDVKRNGAASTSVSPNVANDWGASSTRVVLRALVPRTAAISVPAYGINVHSEREVVIAGTAWKGWDAWRDKAPDFGKVPLAA